MPKVPEKTMAEGETPDMKEGPVNDPIGTSNVMASDSKVLPIIPGNNMNEKGDMACPLHIDHLNMTHTG